MRETPAYYLLLWHSERTDHAWTETYLSTDEACSAFEEAETLPVAPGVERAELVAAVALVRTLNGPIWSPLSMPLLTEIWRRDKEEERAAMLAERRAYREDLI